MSSCPWVRIEQLGVGSQAEAGLLPCWAHAFAEDTGSKMFQTHLKRYGRQMTNDPKQTD